MWGKEGTFYLKKKKKQIYDVVFALREKENNFYPKIKWLIVPQCEREKVYERPKRYKNIIGLWK